MRLNRMGEGREVVNTLRKVHSQQALSIALSVTLHTVEFNLLHFDGNPLTVMLTVTLNTVNCY